MGDKAALSLAVPSPAWWQTIAPECRTPGGSSQANAQAPQDRVSHTGRVLGRGLNPGELLAVGTGPLPPSPTLLLTLSPQPPPGCVLTAQATGALTLRGHMYRQ
jgi:hypothetical protein